MIRRPPSSPLFPSTPLCRSLYHTLGHFRKRSRRAVSDRRNFLRRGRGSCSIEICFRIHRHRISLGGGEGKEIESHRRRRSEEHTSELQSRQYLVCRLLLEKK